MVAVLLLLMVQARQQDMGAGAEAGHQEEHVPAGLQVSQAGYTLESVEAPGAVAEPGTLSFTVTGPDGEPLTDCSEVQEQRLHLIVVSTDTARFSHVHPVMDDAGVWSIDWEWDAAGPYKLFADFMPTELGEELTLARNVLVAGDLTPVPLPSLSGASETGDYQVTLTGDLVAGESSPMTVRIEHDGQPVTDLEPYLGAYGHLVALRDGDLAYIHVHAEEAAEAGEKAGPEVSFRVEAPTPGTYPLFLDFQVGGEVRTADFTVEAGRGGQQSAAAAEEDDDDDDDHGGHGDH